MKNKEQQPTAPASAVIVSIESTPEVATDVVDLIHLSNGTTLRTWNGNSCFDVHDVSSGRVEIGAEIVDEIGHEDHTEYVFA